MTNLKVSMEYNFCQRCAEQLQAETTDVYICVNGHHTYANPKPAAGVLFLRNGSVLLGRRAIDPLKGVLDSIGGFVDMGETYEQAAIREVEEESGLQRSDYGELNYLCSAISPYEFEGQVYQVLSVFFTAKLSPRASAKAQSDISSIEEIPLSELDLNEVGHQDQKTAMKTLLAKEYK